MRDAFSIQRSGASCDVTARAISLYRWTFGALTVLVLWWMVSGPAQAAHKCVDAFGRTVYQDLPCANNQQQKTLPPTIRSSGPKAATESVPAAEMTVGDFMRTPMSPPDAAPCVKAFEQEIARQYAAQTASPNTPRSDADRRKLDEIRHQCDELHLSKPLSQEEREAEQKRTQQMLVQEREKIELQLQKVRSHCAKAQQQRAPGDRTPVPTQQDCAQEIQQLEAALRRIP